MAKQALILTWNGFQDQEVIYPYYRLLEDEFTVSIAAEKTGDIFGIFGTKVECTVPIHFLEVKNFDFLVLPGGVKALEKLRQEQDAISFISEWNKEGKLIASTCHGAQLLISAKVVDGREISGYYSIRDDIVNAGGTYIDAPFVVDKNIVSSPHYKYMGLWMKAALDIYYLISYEL
jgi:protease I